MAEGLNHQDRVRIIRDLAEVSSGSWSSIASERVGVSYETSTQEAAERLHNLFIHDYGSNAGRDVDELMDYSGAMTRLHEVMRKGDLSEKMGITLPGPRFMMTGPICADFAYSIAALANAAGSRVGAATLYQGTPGLEDHVAATITNRDGELVVVDNNPKSVVAPQESWESRLRENGHLRDPKIIQYHDGMAAAEAAYLNNVGTQLVGEEASVNKLIGMQILQRMKRRGGTDTRLARRNVASGTYSELKKEFGDIETFGEDDLAYIAEILDPELESLDVLSTEAPYAPTPWVARGNLERVARRHESAVDSYQIALDLFPNMPGAHYGMNQSLKALGRDEEARAVRAEFREREAAIKGLK